MRVAALLLAAIAATASPVFRRQDEGGGGGGGDAASPETDGNKGGEGDAAAVPSQCAGTCTPLIPILMTCKPNDCGACSPDKLQQLTACYQCMGAASNITIAPDVANDMVKQLCGDGVQVTLGAAPGVSGSGTTSAASSATPTPKDGGGGGDTQTPPTAEQQPPANENPSDPQPSRVEPPGKPTDDLPTDKPQAPADDQSAPAASPI